jgi:hypothetical protein
MPTRPHVRVAVIRMLRFACGLLIATTPVAMVVVARAAPVSDSAGAPSAAAVASLAPATETPASTPRQRQPGSMAADRAGFRAAASSAAPRFAAHGAADDGSGGQDLVRFPPLSVVGALTSRLLSATFFADDFSVEYALTDGFVLASVSTATAAVHEIGELTIVLSSRLSIAADPSSGQLYGIESDDPCTHTLLITIDKTNGASTAVGTLAPCSQSLAIDSNEAFYSIDRATNAVQVLEAGTSNELGSLGITTDDTSWLAIVPGTDVLMLFQFDGGTTMYTVDRVSGLATLVGTMAGAAPLSAIALAPDDIFVDGFEP